VGWQEREVNGRRVPENKWLSVDLRCQILLGRTPGRELLETGENLHNENFSKRQEMHKNQNYPKVPPKEKKVRKNQQN